MAKMPDLLSAQTIRQQTAYSADAPQQALSASPFLPLFGYFQAEYERVINPNVTFAFAGSLTEWDDDRYRHIDAKLRLYPQENALRGVGLAASIGLGSIRRNGVGEDELRGSSRVRPTGRLSIGDAF